MFYHWRGCVRPFAKDIPASEEPTDLASGKGRFLGPEQHHRGGQITLGNIPIADNDRADAKARRRRCIVGFVHRRADQHVLPAVAARLEVLWRDRQVGERTAVEGAADAEKVAGANLAGDQDEVPTI